MLRTVVFDRGNGGPGVGCRGGSTGTGEVRSSFVGVWARQLSCAEVLRIACGAVVCGSNDTLRCRTPCTTEYKKAGYKC